MAELGLPSRALPPLPVPSYCPVAVRILGALLGPWAQHCGGGRERGPPGDGRTRSEVLVGCGTSGQTSVTSTRASVSVPGTSCVLRVLAILFYSSYTISDETGAII